MQVLDAQPLPSHRDGTRIIVREFPSDKLGLSADFSRSYIYNAICEQNPRHALFYIKKGENVNIKCHVTGNTLLHVIMVEASPITETKFVPFVYQLSTANVDFDVLNNDGFSPVRLAIKMHLLELMVALIKCGATCHHDKDLDLIASCSGPVEYEFRSAYQKFSPGYWGPVEEDKAFKVNVLVKSWSRINIQKEDKTLIEFAKEKGAQDKIVKMLMDNENSIEFAHATIAGDRDRMGFLLQHYSVDLDTKDYSHKENYFEPYCPLTLYGAAIKYGHKHILHLLKPTSIVNVKRGIGGDDSMNEHSSSVCNIL